MASHKHRKRPGNGPSSWRCACGKKAYSTWRHAEWDSQQQRNKDRGRRREQPYWSAPCRAYHVGSLPKRKRT